jgi:hypothetical protein
MQLLKQFCMLIPNLVTDFSYLVRVSRKSRKLKKGSDDHPDVCPVICVQTSTCCVPAVYQFLISKECSFELAERFPFRSTKVKFCCPVYCWMLQSDWNRRPVAMLGASTFERVIYYDVVLKNDLYEYCLRTFVPSYAM